MQTDIEFARAMGIKLDEPIPEPQARHPSQADLWRDTACAWKAQSDRWETCAVHWEALYRHALERAEKAEAQITGLPE